MISVKFDLLKIKVYILYSTNMETGPDNMPYYGGSDSTFNGNGFSSDALTDNYTLGRGQSYGFNGSTNSIHF